MGIHYYNRTAKQRSDRTVFMFNFIFSECAVYDSTSIGRANELYDRNEILTVTIVILDAKF